MQEQSGGANILPPPDTNTDNSISHDDVVQKIYGPKTFHYYKLDIPKSNYKKRIMLFGEQHLEKFEKINESKFINIKDFFNLVFIQKSILR